MITRRDLLSLQVQQKRAVSGPRVEWRLASSYPPSADLLHGAAIRVSERVSAMTGGQFTIRVYAAGELVPPLQVMDAVMQGTVQAGLSPGYFYIGKHPALAFDTGVPFGLTTRQQLSWLWHGGGLDLLNEVWGQFGLRSLTAIASPGQMGGWFREPIEALSDLAGLRFRIPGIGGEIMTRLGVTVQVLSGAEIYPALERGAIDATEWVGPYDDEKLGLHQIAKNYYYPGWWEPGVTMGLLVSDDSFRELPSSYQRILEVACGETAIDRLAIYDVEEPRALRRLIEDHGVMLRRYPEDVLDAAWRESNAYLKDQSSRNADFARVYASWDAFRTSAFGYARGNELSYRRDAFPRVG
ncbi:MAG TPA: ABC transporter substrate-binding protein [Gemmatimonadetes bacterium]|nr:ABC transporter substrate-binding protein [Gemmatimonadota bacterium]HBV06864.1 ABC transporter substrate-binding protein [Gemmatimonadota bacterium]